MIDKTGNWYKSNEIRTHPQMKRHFRLRNSSDFKILQKKVVKGGGFEKMLLFPDLGKTLVAISGYPLAGVLNYCQRASFAFRGYEQFGV